MGNCLKKESTTQRAGDDWDSPVPETLFSGDLTRSEKTEEDSLLGDSKNRGGESGVCCGDAGAAGTEVKIKITKKQLEELLGRTDVKGLSVEQLLAKLMDASDRFETHVHKSWRPALQSIPECGSVRL